MAMERELQLDEIDAELAWELVTRRDDLEAWLGAEVELDATPGSSGRVVDQDGTVRRLVVEEVDQGRRLTWRWWTEEPAGDGAQPDASWDAARVEISLMPTPDGTVLRVVETPLASTVTASAVGTGVDGASAWAGRLFDLQVLGLVATVLIRA